MVVSQGCGEQSQELMGELKSLLGHRKVSKNAATSMLLLVRGAEVIWLMPGLLGDRSGRLLLIR